MKNKFIIDFEFNGLPRYDFEPEITQVKIMNLKTGEKICRNFKTHNKGVCRPFYGEIKGGKTYFSAKIFSNMLKSIGGKITDNFYGFNIDTDTRLLSNAGVYLQKYNDIQWRMRLSSKYEAAMAYGGSSLELCYYLVTGKVVTNNTHNGVEELDLIYSCYKAAYRGRPQKRLNVFPWGDLAGMPLSDYAYEETRRAKGYYYNNNNALADSLEHWLRYYDEI